MDVNTGRISGLKYKLVCFLHWRNRSDALETYEWALFHLYDRELTWYLSAPNPSSSLLRNADLSASCKLLDATPTMSTFNLKWHTNMYFNPDSLLVLISINFNLLPFSALPSGGTWQYNMIKYILKRGKESDTCLATDSRHRWSAQMTIIKL